MEQTLDMKALFSLTYGMYIVNTAEGGRLNGQIANTVMQITSEPLCVATCLNKANLTTELIQKSGIFSVAVLEEDVPMTFIGQFGFKSGRDIDKFANVQYELGPTGAPLIKDWSIAPRAFRRRGAERAVVQGGRAADLRGLPSREKGQIAQDRADLRLQRAQVTP